VYSLDWRADLVSAKHALAPAGVQGNLDPVLLASNKASAVAKARALCQGLCQDPAFVFNLGHGVLPYTPVENVTAVIEAVHGVALTISV
jgi:uroporphyrinogen decarboxylase